MLSNRSRSSRSPGLAAAMGSRLKGGTACSDACRAIPEGERQGVKPDMTAGKYFPTAAYAFQRWLPSAVTWTIASRPHFGHQVHCSAGPEADIQPSRRAGDGNQDVNRLVMVERHRTARYAYHPVPEGDGTG